jgi:hypothetical protein
MKVVGMGAPEWVRIVMGRDELDLVIDALLEQRELVSRRLVEVYDDPGRSVRDVDDAHDELRGIETILMRLEQTEHRGDGSKELLGPTAIMVETIDRAARQALRQLGDAHDRFTGLPVDGSRDALLRTAATIRAIRAILTTVVSLREIDRGPDLRIPSHR